MQKYMLFFSIIFLNINTFAQTVGKKGYIGIIVGPSTPIGDFADANVNNKNAGFAKGDYSISDVKIDFGYRFGKNVGISASYFTCDYNINLIANNYTMAIGGIKAGPMYSIAIGDKLFFDTKINFGYIFTSLILVDHNIISNDGFGLLIGLDCSFRYNLFKRWCLIAECEYFLSNPKFDDGQKKNIEVINLGGGVAFRL